MSPFFIRITAKIMPKNRKRHFTARNRLKHEAKQAETQGKEG